nr:hypothetical protein [uncultured Catonella sp.]
MKKRLMGIVLGVAFLAASFGISEQIKADIATEDIVPDLNVIRSLEEKDQINMYRTVVDEEGYQNITLNFDASQKDKVKNGWTLKVYDENKEEIYKMEGIKSQFTSGNFSFTKDKTVYISIESSSTTSLFMPKGVEYNLNFHTYEANDYESEPNNKYINANEIVSGTYIRGNLINKSDEDYYVVKVNETGYTELFFEIVDFVPDKIGNGWDIEIYDKNKNLLYKEDEIKKDVKFPELPLAKEQEIYIRVMAKGNILSSAPEGVEYKLRADVNKTGSWEVENNNSFSRANKLKGTISANILNDTDVDYFTFNTTKTSKYKLSLDTGDNVDKEYKVEIFVNNKSKTVLDKQTKGDKNFTFKAKKGQKVWVKISGVSGYSPIGNKYTIKYKAVKTVKNYKNKKNTKKGSKKEVAISKK